MKKNIAQIAKEILLTKPEYKGLNSIAYGDVFILDEIYTASGMKLKNPHPLNKNNAVLNALDVNSKSKKPIFKKEYFRAHKGLARMFTLIEEKI